MKKIRVYKNGKNENIVFHTIESLCFVFAKQTSRLFLLRLELSIQFKIWDNVCLLIEIVYQVINVVYDAEKWKKS